MLTGIAEIRFILIQINTSIILGHRFKKANTLKGLCHGSPVHFV